MKHFDAFSILCLSLKMGFLFFLVLERQVEPRNCEVWWHKRNENKLSLTLTVRVNGRLWINIFFLICSTYGLVKLIFKPRHELKIKRLHVDDGSFSFLSLLLYNEQTLQNNVFFFFLFFYPLRRMWSTSHERNWKGLKLFLHKIHTW